MSDQEYIKNDEINLCDYIKVILKRKKIIFAIFFVAMIAAAIVNFLTPKIYEVSATIRIGAISEPLISKPEAIQMLKGQKMLNAVIKKLNLDMNILELKNMIKIEGINSTSFLELKIQHSDPDLAVKILNVLSDSFILEGKKVHDKKAAFLNEQLQELKKRNNFIEERMRNLDQLIYTQPADLDSSFLRNTLVNYESIYNSLRNTVYLLKRTLLNSQEFEVFEPPIKPKSPIKPKKKQTVAIFGIVSLMVGVLSAFFMEYWQASKQT